LIIVSGCSGNGIMKAELYGNVKFKVSDLGVEKRNVENEEFTI